MAAKKRKSTKQKEPEKKSLFFSRAGDKKKKPSSGAKKGARKPSMTKKRKQAHKSEKIMAGFKKLSVIILIFLLFVWALGWYILSDGPARTSLWLSQKAMTLSADIGFSVRNILVEGRDHADSDALLAVINVREGDPLFSFIPGEAKKQIERIEWVKSAYVERRLPDTIYIRLKERTPEALWMNDGILSLVDEEGTVITRDGLEKFKDLMMVQGTGAPERTSELLAVLKDARQLTEMIDHAVLQDERRWDLILSDNKRIKLPEHNVVAALDHIMERHKENSFLTNETVIEIDARYQDRLIVRTKLGDVQDYKAGVK